MIGDSVLGWELIAPLLLVSLIQQYCREKHAGVTRFGGFLDTL
jgi:hypothetical protein